MAVSCSFLLARGTVEIVPKDGAFHDDMALARPGTSLDFRGRGDRPTSPPCTEIVVGLSVDINLKLSPI